MSKPGCVRDARVLPEDEVGDALHARGFADGLVDFAVREIDEDFPVCDRFECPFVIFLDDSVLVHVLPVPFRVALEFLFGGLHGAEPADGRHVSEDGAKLVIGLGVLEQGDGEDFHGTWPPVSDLPALRAQVGLQTGSGHLRNIRPIRRRRSRRQGICASWCGSFLRHIVEIQDVRRVDLISVIFTVEHTGGVSEPGSGLLEPERNGSAYALV